MDWFVVLTRTFFLFLLLSWTLPLTANDGIDGSYQADAHQRYSLVETDELPDIEPGEVLLDRGEIDSLIRPGTGRRFQLPSLEKHVGNTSGRLEFQRITLFADHAAVRVLSERGEQVRPRGDREFFLATNRTTGIGMAVDRNTGEVRGFVARNRSRLAIKGSLLGTLKLTEIQEAGPATCASNLSEHSLGSDPEPALAPYVSQSNALPGEIISYEAVVAVDTDNEWMDGFSDDADAAMRWIEDAFLAMNVFFERDLELRLLIGDVFLRTATDPYSVTGGNRSEQLDEFGAYWKDHHSDVYRQFATLFSGRGISGGSFSGIAWLDQYCDYGRTWGGRTPGSYSYNAIGNRRSAAGTALYIGHELGHNMGSPHTHCYTPAVDECYSGEDGCFNGTPSCPVSGSGTIMSYCHVNGCGGNRQEFHSNVQTLIESKLATELLAGCILPHTPALETIFSNGFEN